MSGLTRNLDFVFCIDGTESMEAIMDNVKTKLVELCEKTRTNILDSNENVGNMRARLIVFRDYGVDKNPMEVSDWFDLNPDFESLKSRLDIITPTGGGDFHENGLEALYLALTSDFVIGPTDRQVVVLVSDADALPMGERASSPKYPSDMGSLDDLVDIWMGLFPDPPIKFQQYTKMLFFLAPAKTAYEELAILLGSGFCALKQGEGIACDMGVLAKVIHAGHTVV